MNKKKYYKSDGVDFSFIDLVLEKIFKKLAEKYFRVQLIEKYKLPIKSKRPIIYILNHAGMSMPWDSFMFLYLYYKKVKKQKIKINSALVRPITDNSVISNRLLSLYFVKDTYKKFGAVSSTFEDFNNLAKNKEKIFYYPEGIRGISKGFNNRHRLQRFSKSLIYVCKKTNPIIVPITVINSEYLNPYSYSLKTLNKLLNFIKIPFFPLGINSLLCSVPNLFFFSFPAKLIYVVEKPLKINIKSNLILEEKYLEQKAEAVRNAFQLLLDANLKKYYYPYKLGFRGIIKILLSEISPLNWPRLFHSPFGTKSIYIWMFNVPVLGWALLFLFRNQLEGKINS